MSTADTFRRMFDGVSLEAEDLLLLEAFQIAYLPGWVPERELAAVLHAHPVIGRYLVKRCPSVSDYVDGVMARFGAAESPDALSRCTDTVVWTIADLLVYNRCPEAYDAQAFHGWNFREVTSIADLEGKVVVDAGSGTGRVALEAARSAKLVFAVEPVARSRQFVRDRAAAEGLPNLFVVDGFLDALPLPDGFAEVLITSHALGWRLEAELEEFERVVKPGGFVIHCPGTADQPSDEAQHQLLAGPVWQYASARYEAPDGWKRKYWKRL